MNCLISIIFFSWNWPKSVVFNSEVTPSDLASILENRISRKFVYFETSDLISFVTPPSPSILYTTVDAGADAIVLYIKCLGKLNKNFFFNENNFIKQGFIDVYLYLC